MPARVAVVAGRGREEERPPGHELLGLPHVGQDLLRRLLRAGGEPGEGQRGAHQRQELAAALRVLEHRGLLRELAVQELEEGGRVGQLVEALPVARRPVAPARRRTPSELDGDGGQRVPGSSVARGAGDLRLDVVLRHELAPELELVRPAAARRCCRPRSSAAGTSRAAGGTRGTTPSAATSPARRSGIWSTRPVTGGAADALVHVGAVVEVDEVGQVVDLRPLDRGVRRASSRAPARAWGSGSRSASGSSCRSWSAGSRPSPTCRPRCGSSGSRCPCRPRGAGGRRAPAARGASFCRVT